MVAFLLCDIVCCGRPLIKRPASAKYRTLLSIDGGGIRGIIPVMILMEVERDIKEHIFERRDTLVPADVRDRIHSEDDFDIDLTDYFDVVAGTSIGSLLACYIAARGRGSERIVNDPEIVANYGRLRSGSMEACRAAFREYSSRVFPRRNIFRRIGRVFRPAYASEGLEETLRAMFGETTMNDMETSCLITSYDLRRNAACSFLHGCRADAGNYTVRTAVRQGPRTSAAAGAATESHPEEHHQPTECRDGWDPDVEFIKGTNYRLRDIALASSSAPTYFRPARISPVDMENPEEFILVDGGVVANNPTLQALSYAPSTFSPGEGDIREVAVFSVGCGTVDPSAPHDDEPGIAWWLTSGYLIDAFSNGTGEYIQAVVDLWFYHNLRLPFGQYVRIQRSEPRNTEVGEVLGNMDNADNVPTLEEVGRQMAKTHKAEIQRFVRDYLFAMK